ncbi:MAG: sterol desaturase family protein [Leptospiraceae bacterium]|nr:sterol desaturase family protein [Leptospiraceae bacterium]
MGKKGLTIKEAVAQSHQYRIRMFKSDFLEKFSYVHPLVPFYIFIPVILFCSFASFYFYSIPVLKFAYLAVLGLFFWTIIEYTLHRFLFHPPMTNEFLKKVYFYTHGIHHEAMNDASRLVMPPAVSIPVSTGIYFAARALMGADALPFFVGFITGYTIYDFLHFASHFFAFDNKIFKIIKKKHMVHHHKDHHSNYGFTSPLWDYVFGTVYKKKPSE